MAQHNQLGKQGEGLAVQFLQKLGYTIIETNWQKHKFEIDIIAQHNNEIVFVEVKTRSTAYFGKPEEAVTRAKQKHLIEGADFYLQEKEIDLEARFDVISVIINHTTEINHIKEAFNY
ncbi:MAG: YraN family protein [Flavobacteriales bacterium]|nr:YraN family protein [Flavobacteriales bacterium]MCB9365266.1 YraN family protein [Flavobacteriales bacterium]